MMHFECYYKVLGVPETASQDDIKKAYKKLALVHHPDKNPENSEDSHIVFTKIKKAYETLFDPQERSYYDTHKKSFGFMESLDRMINPLKYRTLLVFEEYDDSTKGYFTIYRDLFNQIMNEERAFVEDKEFPDFGYSHSPYAEVVRPFYSFWSSYMTVKTFKWCEKYDATTARNRAEARAIEKDNKVFRNEAKKAYNKDLQSLVAFIKKKDPRILAQKESLEQNAITVKDMVENKKAAAKKKNATYQNSYPEEYNEDITNLENFIHSEFNENTISISSSELTDLEFKNGAAIFEDGYIWCLLCEKSFSSTQTFRNHTNSKKHKELLQLLKSPVNEESKEDNTQEVTSVQPSKKKAKNKKPKNKTINEITENIDQLSINGPNTTTTPSIEYICEMCFQQFSSKNKLFAHIKEMNHASIKKDSGVRPLKNNRRYKQRS